MSVKFVDARLWAEIVANAGAGGATEFELKTLGFEILAFTFFACRVLSLLLQAP
jgi:hypothetical protein